MKKIFFITLFGLLCLGMVFSASAFAKNMLTARTLSLVGNTPEANGQMTVEEEVLLKCPLTGIQMNNGIMNTSYDLWTRSWKDSWTHTSVFAKEAHNIRQPYAPKLDQQGRTTSEPRYHIRA